MSTEMALTRRDHALLIGDAVLLTMGTVTLGLAVAFSSEKLQGLLPDVVLGFGGGILLMATGVLGVIATWLLHERRVTPVSVIGALCGAPVAGLVVPLMAGLSYLLGLPLRLVTDSEFAGPIAMLTIVSIAIAVLIVWLLSDAFRDIRAVTSLHIRLDWARLAAAAAFLLLVAISIWLTVAQPGPEQGEAPIWAIAAGLIAAGVIGGADVASILDARSNRAKLTTAATE